MLSLSAINRVLAFSLYIYYITWCNPLKFREVNSRENLFWRVRLQFFLKIANIKSRENELTKVDQDGQCQ